MVQVGAGGVSSAKYVPVWCPRNRGDRSGRTIQCPNGMPMWIPAQPLPRRPRVPEYPA
jgi:hypothetical protein